MKKLILAITVVAFTLSVTAQKVMTPEMLLQLGKVNPLGITKDGKSIIYSVKTYSIADNKSTTKKYIIPIAGGAATPIDNTDALLPNNRISPDGK